MEDVDYNEINNRYKELCEGHKITIKILKECEIEVEVAKLEGNVESFKAQLQRRNNLQEEAEELSREIQKVVGQMTIHIMESGYNKKALRKSLLYRVLGGKKHGNDR